VLRGSSVAAHTNGAIADLIADVLRARTRFRARGAADQGQFPRRVIELLTAMSTWTAGPARRAEPPADGREHATVPVVIDGDGNCHVYVDASALLPCHEHHRER